MADVLHVPRDGSGSLESLLRDYLRAMQEPMQEPGESREFASFAYVGMALGAGFRISE